MTLNRTLEIVAVFALGFLAGVVYVAHTLGAL